MKVIYKYPLAFRVRQELIAPIEQILTIQIQNDRPCLWAVVDTKLDDKVFNICLSGTGEQDGHDFSKLSYISTTQFNGYVFHWFYGEAA